MKHLLLAGIALFFSAGSAWAQPDSAGYIKTLSGQARVIRGENVLPAEIGQLLYPGDAVRTDENGSVGILLEDDTLLSLGPNSHLNLEDYAFNPREGLLSIAARLIKGSLAYVSGAIGRLAPDKVRVATPDAVISSYGTRFLVKVEGNR
ncbi:MAG: FecR family protein [Desulfobacteraceae bacterium]|jgi:hypothetical protein|nr:FecR family protein [Desulfobacteraceae bacterium]MDD3990920.1 FecR family protein [Desulfobacteraceae bacterium]